MFKEGKTKKEIIQLLNISKPTVIDWLSSETYQDNRGWKSDKHRKEENNQLTIERIRTLKNQRIENNYFVGSQYVQMDYDRVYPGDPLPSIWFIDETVRQAKLQTKKPKKDKRVGGSKYLLYPIKSIENLGNIHQSADFVGRKYIAGRTEPINIFSSSYYRPFKLFQIKRVLAEKATCAIDILKTDWQKFPIPDVLRIDNALSFRGTASGKRAVGMFLKFLLNLDVIPLFGSPSKPWTNPHIEGHNRTFNEKIWGNNHFDNLDQIDQECHRFNGESLDYFNYRYSDFLSRYSLRHLDPNKQIETDKLLTTQDKKIYLTRFVESYEYDKSAHIEIFNETIYLPEQYAHQFVFVEWNLKLELLNIYSEYDQNVILIKQIKFKLNV